MRNEEMEAWNWKGARLKRRIIRKDNNEGEKGLFLMPCVCER
jgi:hypothetical protein